MKTLDELIYYCNEAEPVGALLLSGEWGCGKTYLIEKSLQNALEKTAKILRISLFGITSIEGIHTAVKQMWMNTYYEGKGVSGITEKAKKVKEFVANSDIVPDVIKGIASLDLTSFIEIKNTIGEKSLVLVFDDLERCRMDNIDVLGAINDYCENLKIHTIIVANQDKLQMDLQETKINALIQLKNTYNNQTNNTVLHNAKLEMTILPKREPGAISYLEIKEKIIQRTVKYIPDFVEIVETVIKDMKYEDSEYREFVEKCKSGILDLFAPDREQDSNGIENLDKINRPHNIRSLKCAISDFYRVYKILTENQIDKIDRWFYTFTSYVIAYKADIAKEAKYGTILGDTKVKALYPAFQEQYIFNSVKKWILCGIWNEEQIKFEIETLKEREKALTPGDVLRTHRIMDVDEEVILKGFGELLQRAYKGDLTLDEYVLFIRNSCWARKYGFSLLVVVDWDKVQKGINCCIKQLVELLPAEQPLHSIIGSDNKGDFTEDEWKTYEIIDDFKNNNKLMFSKNRKLYIEEMKKDVRMAFLEVQNKRFNAFDEEMANTTAEAFKKGNNEVKASFAVFFKEIWQNNIMSNDINIKESMIGFEKLLVELRNQTTEFDELNKTFAKIHTDAFIVVVNELVEKIKAEQLND